jgi:hypothetical protein
MCVNCVSSIDAAAAAVGGVAGLRMWLGSTKLLATPRRIRTAAAMVLLLVLILAGVALANHV